MESVGVVVVVVVVFSFFQARNRHTKQKNKWCQSESPDR